MRASSSWRRRTAWIFSTRRFCDRADLTERWQSDDRTSRAREEILGVHTKEKPLGEDVDLHRIAQTTAGFTGADLENLMNEAAINTAKEGRKFLTQTDIEKAFIKVGIGAEKTQQGDFRERQEDYRIP